ncbi:MAG: GatB/YqeY domain-containing protein [Solirubrobacteraceae bacterium]
MTIADQVRADLSDAMKSGDRDRVGALRFVLSELQKAAKEGGDETTALRRERKRRLDAVDQYQAAGRDDLAEREQQEAGLIEAYLPPELSETELDEIVSAAVGETGASSAQEMGRVMGVVMPRVGGRADGKRVSAKVREALGA